LILATLLLLRLHDRALALVLLLLGIDLNELLRVRLDLDEALYQLLRGNPRRQLPLLRKLNNLFLLLALFDYHVITAFSLCTGIPAFDILLEFFFVDNIFFSHNFSFCFFFLLLWGSLFFCVRLLFFSAGIGIFLFQCSQLLYFCWIKFKALCLA